jgi:hypothetical protein
MSYTGQDSQRCLGGHFSVLRMDTAGVRDGTSLGVLLVTAAIMSCLDVGVWLPWGRVRTLNSHIPY